MRLVEDSLHCDVLVITGYNVRLGGVHLGVQVPAWGCDCLLACVCVLVAVPALCSVRS